MFWLIRSILARKDAGSPLRGELRLDLGLALPAKGGDPWPLGLVILFLARISLIMIWMRTQYIGELNEDLQLLLNMV